MDCHPVCCGFVPFGGGIFFSGLTEYQFSSSMLLALALGLGWAF